jgi:hypothetical protein
MYLPVGTAVGFSDRESDLPCLAGSSVLLCTGDGGVDEGLARLLTKLGASVTSVCSPGDLLLAAEDTALYVDTLICTSRTEWIDPLELVRRFRKLQPQVEVLVRSDGVVLPPDSPEYQVLDEPLSFHQVVRRIEGVMRNSRTMRVISR